MTNEERRDTIRLDRGWRASALTSPAFNDGWEAALTPAFDAPPEMHLAACVLRGDLSAAGPLLDACQAAGVGAGGAPKNRRYNRPFNGRNIYVRIGANTVAITFIFCSLEGPCIGVSVDKEWPILYTCRDVLAALARRPDMTPDEFCSVLRGLGFKDLAEKDTDQCVSVTN